MGSLEFPTPCHNCGKEGVTRMCTCEIPFFKELIVMSFTCEFCGSRSSEVKTGGGVPPLGKKMVYRVDGREQLDRDIFKSETAEVTINELGLTIVAGSLGGIYSTIEGLLMKLVETFRDNNPFVGDSADVEYTQKFKAFVDKCERLQAGDEKFTLIMDDPLDNSWVYNPIAPTPDPNMEITIYERTDEQNEELGIKYLMEAEKAEQEAKLNKTE